MANDALGKLVADTQKLLEEYTDKPSRPPMGIVGGCPQCGSPIYSDKMLLEQDIPNVRFSCDCRNRITCQGLTREFKMETK